MKKLCVVAIPIGLIVLVSVLAGQAQAPTPRVAAAAPAFGEEVQPLFQKYCYTCHNATARVAGVDLSSFTTKESMLRDWRLWEFAAQRIDAGSMPPMGRPAPTAAEKKMLVDWITQALTPDGSATDSAPVVLPRLTRAEYASTIHDLLGVDVDVSSVLPNDPEGLSGFTNDRGSLLMTDTLLERYLKAAELVVDTAFASRKPNILNVRQEAETARRETFIGTKAETEFDDGVPGFLFTSHRITKFQSLTTHIEVPESGAYRIRIRGKVTTASSANGGVRSDGTVATTPGAELSFRAGVRVSIDRPEVRPDAAILLTSRQFQTYDAIIYLTKGSHDLLVDYDFDLPPWVPRPLDRPARSLPDRADVEKEVIRRTKLYTPPPATLSQLAALPGYMAPTGDKLIDAEGLIKAINTMMFAIGPEGPEAGANAGVGGNGGLLRQTESGRIFAEYGFMPILGPAMPPNPLAGGRGRGAGAGAGAAAVGGAAAGGGRGRGNAPQNNFVALSELIGCTPETLVNFWLELPGPRLKESMQMMADLRRDYDDKIADSDRNVGSVFLDWYEVTGPVALPATVAALPAPNVPAREYLATFVAKAFRRPLRPGELDRYTQFFAAEVKRGMNQETALKHTMVAVLTSPNFLYRDVAAPAPRTQASASDYVLASRLSYFLTSSMPDQALQVAAEGGALRQPAGLLAEADRLIKSPGFGRFAKSFTAEWLGLSAIGENRNPDNNIMQEWSPYLADDMREEVRLDFQRLVQMNGSLLELLDSKQTYLNERLARLYGIDGVEGPEMRLVTLTDRNRGGLLATAAVLTATSVANRTSPVLRGKFILEKILGERMPPPPPVPPLPEDNPSVNPKTLRETLAQHRANPTCAACHNRMDPAGFALENYDLVGRYRTADPGGKVDASGRMPDGTTFSNFVEFRDYLVKRRARDVVRNVAARMFAYALGREIDYRDAGALRQIVAKVEADGNRAGTLVREIISSAAFRFQGNEDASTKAVASAMPVQMATSHATQNRRIQ